MMSLDAMAHILREGHAPGMGNKAVIQRKRHYVRGLENPVREDGTEVIFAIVCPGTPRIRKLLPEEIRQQPFLVLYTEQFITAGYTTRTKVSGLPDLVEVNGRWWQVAQVTENRELHYFRAVAVPCDPACCPPPFCVTIGAAKGKKGCADESVRSAGSRRHQDGAGRRGRKRKTA